MRKLKWLFGIVLAATLGWYFFLKKEHYQVRFTSSQPPGVVYQHLKDWSIFGKQDSLDIEWIDGTRYSLVEQKVIGLGDTLQYLWKIGRINDSVTAVEARITDSNHYWLRKIQVPFGLGNFSSTNIARVETVGKQLLKKAESFRATSIGDTLFPSTFCAYVSLKDVPINQKAKYMLSNIRLVMDYIKGNNIELIGDPFLQVTSWDQDKDIIDFDFCFPIPENDSLPPTAEVRFKKTKDKNFLKADFNGNYRISDKGWYYVLDYANRHQLEIEPLPTEVFLNDPHEGGNSLEWKAHILVPLK